MKKITFLMAVIAALTIYSCAEDNNSALEPDNGNTMQVMVKVYHPDPSTKMLGGVLPGGSVANIINGMAFFISKEGIIVSRGALNNQILTGQLFTGIKSSATEVYIVANYTPGETAFATCTTKADIKAIEEVISDHTGIPYAILANASDLTGFDATKYDNQIKAGTAHVLLCPIISRIEITDIKTLDPIIQNYTIAGLYIDNFYPALYMACGKGGARAKVFGGQALNNLNNALFPISDKSVVNSRNGKVSPDSFNSSVIWIYHTSPTLGGAANTPRIVVVFSSITIKVDGVTTTVNNKFLTVTGYKETNNAVIQNFEAGKIYNIPGDSFVFKYSDIADTPNPPLADIQVNVEIKPWTDITFSPIL